MVDRAPESSPTWSVRELSVAIGERLREAFPTDVWVRGEIHDLSRPQSGHVYFSLVESGNDGAGRREPDARLSVMLAASDKTRVNRLLRKAGGRVRMSDGTEVRIRGRLDWYEPRGQLQFRMASIDPAFTLGQLAAARAELLDRLRAEGVLDANRRLSMPMLPLRIGVVTSSGSAAEADLLDELDRSGFAFRVHVADVRVQGLDAPGSVAGAITWFASRDIDVVVLVRGGGATTDLAAFDHEMVARAIAASPHPVVTGVGHEVDRSVADEVAHTAAKTPTAAAQHLVGVVGAALGRAEAGYAAVVGVADRRVHAASQHLDRLAARAATAAASATRTELGRIDTMAARLSPATRRQLGRLDDTLRSHGQRLRSAGRRTLDEADRDLDVLATRVSLGDPVRAMARGWSITRQEDGTMVRSVADAPAGSTIVTTVADGTVTSVVDDGVEHP
ncbi:MAG: exodeoxyribonuclease VII large subunit [Acidimicrobiales bacterium]